MAPFRVYRPKPGPTCFKTRAPMGGDVFPKPRKSFLLSVVRLFGWCQRRSDGVVPVWSAMLPGFAQQEDICHIDFANDPSKDAVKLQVRNWLSCPVFCKAHPIEAFQGYIPPQAQSRTNAYVGAVWTPNIGRSNFAGVQGDPSTSCFSAPLPEGLPCGDLQSAYSGYGGLAVAHCTGMCDNSQVFLALQVVSVHDWSTPVLYQVRVQTHRARSRFLRLFICVTIYKGRPWESLRHRDTTRELRALRCITLPTTHCNYPGRGFPWNWFHQRELFGCTITQSINQSTPRT